MSFRVYLFYNLDLHTHEVTVNTKICGILWEPDPGGLLWVVVDPGDHSTAVGKVGPSVGGYQCYSMW